MDIADLIKFHFAFFFLTLILAMMTIGKIRRKLNMFSERMSNIYGMSLMATLFIPPLSPFSFLLVLFALTVPVRKVK